MIDKKARRHEGKEARKGGVVARSTETLAPPHRSARGFSLIEVLLAIFILGIGIIGIAALFPAGIAQQQRSVDDIMGPLVANNALSVLRSKLKQEQFGSYEDFDCDALPGHQPCYPWEHEQVGTLFGDWPWRRPGVMYVDDPSTADRDERGAIDVFSGDPWTTSNGQSEVPQHIPYSPSFFGGFLGANKPLVIFTQGERMYPMSDQVRNVGDYSQPQYYWDCMFRRYQGKVLVAIFVYRVNAPSGEEYRYSVPEDNSGTGYLLMPFRFDFDDVTNNPPWPMALNTWEANQALFTDITPTQIPETGPGGSFYNLGPSLNDASETTLFKAPGNAWQMTGQWLVDQNNNVLRVLTGREKPGEENRGRSVELVSRIPAMPAPNAYSGNTPFFYDRDPDLGAAYIGTENVVTSIWYLPKYIEVNLGGSSITVSVTPVFVTVEEL